MRKLKYIVLILLVAHYFGELLPNTSNSLAQENTDHDTPIIQNSQIDLSSEDNLITEPSDENMNNENDWAITITPYLWMLAIDGDITVQGTKSPASINFSDIVENLNFAFMGAVKLRKGKFGGYVDSILGFLETNRKTVQTGNGPARIKVEVDLVILEGGLFYRLIDSKMGNVSLGAKTNMKIDLLAGGRWTFLDTKLDIESSPNASGDKNFFDPYVGFNSVFDFPHKINLTTYGDIGGLSVGSDVTWQLWATLGYRFGIFGENNANVLAGYRALSQDYKEGSGENKFEWDVIIHGPVLGLQINL